MEARTYNVHGAPAAASVPFGGRIVRPADRGTLAEWLGDRDAASIGYRAEPRADIVPAGCPRGLGEGDRSRRIWTEPSGVVAFGDAREYGAVHAGDVRRGYGQTDPTTGASCERMALLALIGRSIGGIGPTAEVRAVRAARQAVPGCCRASRRAGHAGCGRMSALAQLDDRAADHV